MSIVDVIRGYVAERGDRVAATFLERGERCVDQLTYAELDHAARAVAHALVDAGLADRPVLLSASEGLDFVRCFLGCLYAGSYVVPIPPLEQKRMRPRIRAIIADARPAALIASSAEEGVFASEFDAQLPVLTPAQMLSASPLPAPRKIRQDDPAFIQYTSGSTSRPKGVAVTHRNIMANQSMIADGFGHYDGLVGVSWLPLHHDMGLIGSLLQPLYHGGQIVLMSPLAFLQKPIRWLRAIDAYGATTSGGPNFAYELCLRHVRDGDIADLDLSRWQVAFCGAEPVRASTMERFAERFAPAGFPAEALYPCYGLAEATLFCTGNPSGSGLRVQDFEHSGNTRRVVSCGAPWNGADVAIVLPDEPVRLPAGAVGEIVVAGDHVAPGFWSSGIDAIVPDAVRQVSLEGRIYLRTGDLGFVRDGELFIVGRLKDIIIVHGVNIHAEDIEETVLALTPEPIVFAAAAISIDDDERSGVVLLCEVDRARAQTMASAALIQALSDTVANAFGIVPLDIVLTRAMTLPRTSSGKIQRSKARELYQSQSILPFQPGAAAHAV
jgi:acyl-CoA synthetase (AMP-forming)/AMP-acid ligase II